MPTIFDEIKEHFKEKLNEDKIKNTIDSEKMNYEIFDLAIDVLLKQVKALRKKNFEETPNEMNTDVNGLVKSIDQEIESTL